MNINKNISFVTFGLNVLLLFFLILESSISVPGWFTPIGRLHTLILHLPIGIGLGLILLFFIKSQFPYEYFYIILKYTLQALAFFTALAAFCGILLSQEAGYEKTNEMAWHKYSGVALSVVFYLFSEYQSKIFETSKAIFLSLSLLFVGIVTVGHLGGNLTHGEDFLLGGLVTQNIKEETNVFKSQVEPIFKAKCIQCHSDKKSKGGLNMSSIEKMLKGGKNGSMWKAHDTLKSNFLSRIVLPLEDKKHMPPKGKSQLTEAEINILNKWIKEGANYKINFADLPNNSFFKQLSNDTEISEKSYDFSAASEKEIQSINSAFCILEPLSSSSPALSAKFFVSSKFEKTKLEDLKKVKEQIVEISLSKMPIDDEGFKLVSVFENLESLNLNQTEVNGSGIEELLKCRKLTHLSLSNSNASGENISKLIKHPSLKNLYVWNLSIDSESIKNWKASNPKLNIEQGFLLADAETMKINPPTLINEKTLLGSEEKVAFKHTLKSVEMRYTLDGSTPDSINSPIYKKPLELTNFTNVKILATKPNWYASDIKEYSFFKSKYIPTSITLLKKTDPKYPGKKEDLLIDLIQGEITNFRNGAYMGFKENDFETVFDFKETVLLNGVTLSYGVHIPSYIFPPKKVSIFYKDESGKYKLLESRTVKTPTEAIPAVVTGMDFKLKNLRTNSIKILAVPLYIIPNWHEGRGTKAWFFTDEVYFY